MVVRSRPSGLADCTSTRWQSGGISARLASSCWPSSAGHCWQKGLRCNITSLAPAPKGGVRASDRAWAAWARSLPSSRLRLMALQAGSTSFSTRASRARWRAASSSPQSRWIGMPVRGKGRRWGWPEVGQGTFPQGTPIPQASQFPQGFIVAGLAPLPLACICRHPSIWSRARPGSSDFQREHSPDSSRIDPAGFQPRS